MDLSPGTDIGLTREQETCLKQQLFKLCVQDEVTSFMGCPDVINDTMFMRFFKQKILEFPLWSSNDKARTKLEELITKLPTYLTVSQRATKHDTQNKKLRVFVVANFNSMLKTPKERRHDLRRTLDDYSPEQDIKEVEDPNERVRQKTVVHLAREVARISLAIFLELEQHGGVDRFFAIVKMHKNLCDLPPLYQKFFKFMGKISAVEMERTYSDPKHVSSLKKLYKLTPIKAVKGLLAITDPAALLDGLLNLFLARPFGVHSVTQKIAAAGSELRHSKVQLGEAKVKVMRALRKRKLSAKQIQHILSLMREHANTVPLPIGEEEDIVGRPVGHEIVDFDRLVPMQTVKNILLEGGFTSELDVLPDAEIEAIREVLVNEMRVKAKSDFVDLWGSRDTADILKELVPTFFGLMSTLKKADVGVHMEKYFRAMKAIVKVSEETKEYGVEERIAAYESVLESLQQDMYGFIHSLFVADAATGSVIYRSFEWYVNMVKFVHRREALDIQQLLLPFSEEERQSIIAELNSVLEYYNTVEKTGKPPTTRPVVSSITKMKPQFLRMLRSRLEPIDTKTPTTKDITTTTDTTTNTNTTNNIATTPTRVRKPSM